MNIKPFLRYGEPNEIRVEVRSGQDSRWYSGAGLHRPVFLHVNHPLHIALDGVRITTLDVEPDQAVVEVATSVVNEGLNTQTVTLTTPSTVRAGEQVEADATPVTVAPGETCLVRQRMYLTDPALWSVDHRILYTARSTLGAAEDEIITSSGSDAAGRPRKGLRINGNRCCCGARASTTTTARSAPQPWTAPRNGGSSCQGGRLQCHPVRPQPAVRGHAGRRDRLGMLVMDEAFDMWLRGQVAVRLCAGFPAVVGRRPGVDGGQGLQPPSVIMYSLGNEIVEVGTPHGARLARQMAEHLRLLDRSRLVTNGVNAALTVIDELSAVMEDAGLNDLGDSMNRLGMGENVTRRTAKSSSVLDVLGLNYAEGRYALDRDRFPHRVIVGSETFPSQIGRLWPMVVDNPNVIGDFTWTGWDYLGEVGIGATVYAEDPDAVASLEREFPYLTAWCGDLYITGTGVRSPTTARSSSACAASRIWRCAGRSGMTTRSPCGPPGVEPLGQLLDLAGFRGTAHHRRGVRGR